MVNTITISGRLVTEPLERAALGVKVTSFRLVHEGHATNPTSIDVEVWDRKAEVPLRRMRRGSDVIVYGRLVHSRWTDESGHSRSKHKISADRIIMVGRDGKEGQEEA